MSDSRSGSGWFKQGCLGCLLLVGVGVLVVVVLFAIAANQVGSEQVESPSSVHDATAPEAEATATTEARGGRVRLAISVGEFALVPAEAGQPLHVEARYDAKTYRLDERFVDSDDAWEYELEFRRVGGGLMSLLKAIVGGTAPELTIHLPPDVPLDLELDASRSGGNIELGGLWLRTLKVNAKQGGFNFRVSEPLRAPIETMTVEASMGGMNFSNLGNASPRTLDVTCSMGGLNLDLEGEWLADAAISVEVSRGEVNLELPRGVTIEGLPGEVPGLGVRDDEIPVPTLRFSTRVAASGGLKVSGTPIGR